MKKIIYTGSFRFPDKDAASQRVLNIGKVFRNLGYEVIFFGWEKEERAQDISPEREFFYDGFRYYSQNELDQVASNPFSKLLKFIFRGDKSILSIKKNIQNNTVDYIVAYNANSYFLYQLHKLSKKNNIKLICDCTEWYEPEHLPGGKFGFANFDNNFRINKIYPRIKNIIVISSFLDKHLKNKGCDTVILPPLVDLRENKWQFNSPNVKVNKDVISLIYAGDPGKKDLLGPFFEALKYVNNKNNFELILLGSSKDFIKKHYFNNEENIPKYVKIIGQVPMDEVPGFYRNADFSILLREDKRYAHAGFPTKLVESLSSGVPLITNDTSDIKKFIKDGFNGFILENHSVEKIIECLQNLLLLSEKEMVVMKENAKKTSSENFDFGQYTNEFKHFLSNLN